MTVHRRTQRSNLSTYHLIIGTLWMAVILSGCQAGSVPPIIAVRPTDSPERAATIAADPDLQAGERIYNLRCAHCHGDAGEGQIGRTIEVAREFGLHLVPPHDATGHTWQHPTQLIRQVILAGIPNPLDQFQMPPFEGVVTDEEITQIIAYIQLWWTDEQRAWQEQLTQRRAELDAEMDASDE